MSKIVNHGLGARETARPARGYRRAMEEGMMEIVPRLKSARTTCHLRHVITLVGLLGTIIGLIRPYRGGAGEPGGEGRAVSASISIAMNNTRSR